MYDYIGMLTDTVSRHSHQPAMDVLTYRHSFNIVFVRPAAGERTLRAPLYYVRPLHVK
jgi:hypothetical protein